MVASPKPVDHAYRRGPARCGNFFHIQAGSTADAKSKDMSKVQIIWERLRL
jgi:hypothetical protein